MIDRKFRGKHIETGKWLYGSYIRRGKRCFILPFEGYPKAKDTEVDPKTVGQFVGQIDKNGKEVWEGDVVLAEMLGGLIETLIIGWGARGFVQIDEEGYKYTDWFHELEVIGNISRLPLRCSVDGEQKGGEQFSALDLRYDSHQARFASFNL